MKTAHLLCATLTALTVMAAAAPSEAVVYCRAVGIPKGCVWAPGRVVVAPVVVRPAPVVVTPAPVVVTPAPVVVAPAPVVVPGVGVPGVGVPGVGVYPRAGSAVNLGGPVNRVGVR